jgi:hypothetical protein
VVPVLFFSFPSFNGWMLYKKDASTKKTLRREFVLVAGCHFFMRRRQIKQKALETGIQSKLSKPQKASVFQPWQRIVPSGWQHNVIPKIPMRS